MTVPWTIRADPDGIEVADLTEHPDLLYNPTTVTVWENWFARHGITLRDARVLIGEGGFIHANPTNRTISWITITLGDVGLTHRCVTHQLEGPPLPMPRA